MAPVNVCTSLEGSSIDTAFISIAHGMLIPRPSLWSGMISLTPLLSEQVPPA
jgi:hypothetical protein